MRHGTPKAGCAPSHCSTPAADRTCAVACAAELNPSYSGDLPRSICKTRLHGPRRPRHGTEHPPPLVRFYESCDAIIVHTEDAKRKLLAASPRP